jgi:hypothetical protein
MASCASSAASTRSVVFQGREVTLEEALESTIRGCQTNLTALQVNLRQLAQMEGGEQALDDDEDFQLAVRLEDECFDLVSGLANLFAELPPIARDIVGGPPTPASKKWYAAHKAERKAAFAAQKAAKAAEAVRARELAATAAAGAGPR